MAVPRACRAERWTVFFTCVLWALSFGREGICDAHTHTHTFPRDAGDVGSSGQRSRVVSPTNWGVDASVGNVAAAGMRFTKSNIYWN